MITTDQQFSLLTNELASSAWTLAAIGLLFESGLADQLREPRSVEELASSCPGVSRERIERCLAVAAVRGVITLEGSRYRLATGVLPSLEPAARLVLQGDLRSHLLQTAAYLRNAIEPRPETGWRHTDPMILQAQGDASSMFATALKARFLGELGDLAARLERPDARFLDVGVGVAALSIAMCQQFPKLRVVGLDPYEAPLALARANVARAGLEDRIELRKTTVHELHDEAAYDVAWLPAFFLGSRADVPQAIERIRAALRPGGWLLMAAVNPSAGEAERAVWSLMMESWGGPVVQAPEVEALVTAGGLTARTFGGPSWIALVAGQR